MSAVAQPMAPDPYSQDSSFDRQHVGWKLFAIYLLMGAVWGLFSELAFESIVPRNQLYPYLQFLKDLIFFLLTGGFLLLMSRRYIGMLEKGQAQLVRAAYYDYLTGLPNQLLFRQELENALTDVRKREGHLAVMFLDLDRFKTIVRTLGHAQGDQLLRALSARLKRCLKQEDLLARLSGDEFALLVREIEGTDTVVGLARAILACLKEPFPFIEHGLHLTASIGIAIYPHDGEDPENLQKNADVAKSRTKEMGGNNFQFYYPGMNELFLQSLILENRLHLALENNEFSLRYQPQLELATGRLSALEALACWKYPDDETISPETFIPLAEETGLIEPIGAWILRQACRQNRAWQDAGLAPQPIAVNVSARQFFQRDFVYLVRSILKETDLAPRWLALEITESILMQDVEQTRTTLAQLKQLGVAIVIDDFGTGYSSLSYLKSFPVDTLKIDRSFVAGLPAERDAAALTAAIIGLAHALGMDVVAEGVEQREQVDFLREHGCDRVQGYWYYPPMPIDECRRLLGTLPVREAG
jgi:diguanylate cyclase (GGDEF)-like protein